MKKIFTKLNVEVKNVLKIVILAHKYLLFYGHHDLKALYLSEIYQET